MATLTVTIFDGTIDSDNLITDVLAGGFFEATGQLHYADGFIFIATGGEEVQAAPVAGGAAEVILDGGSFGEAPLVEVPGVWAGGGQLFVSDSSIGQVTRFDLDTSGNMPVLSNAVVEGLESGAGGFLGALSVDLNDNKIYVGSAGSFGSSIPGEVLIFDVDGGRHRRRR